MNVIELHNRAMAATARVLDALDAPFACALRLWVGWVFVKSGWLKLTSFESTLFLFAEEYRVPFLPPEVAAVAGTVGELGFGVLVMAGLAGRLAALGLSLVNVMAVVAYAHVLLAEGFEAALGQHHLWGLALLVLVIHGPGAWSLDGLFARATPRRGFARASAV
jgi:putative oxidoreductase